MSIIGEVILVWGMEEEWKDIYFDHFSFDNLNQAADVERGQEFAQFNTVPYGKVKVCRHTFTSLQKVD